MISCETSWYLELDGLPCRQLVGCQVGGCGFLPHGLLCFRNWLGLFHMAILAFQGQEVGKPQLTSAFNFCLSYLANIPVTKASPVASCISWAGETPSTLSHSTVECTQAQGDLVASVAINHNYDWLFLLHLLFHIFQKQ